MWPTRHERARLYREHFVEPDLSGLTAEDVGRMRPLLPKKLDHLLLVATTDRPEEFEPVQKAKTSRDGMELKDGIVDVPDGRSLRSDDVIGELTETDLLHTLEEQGYTQEEIARMTLGEIDRTLAGVNRASERQQIRHEQRDNKTSSSSSGTERMRQGNRTDQGFW